MANSTERGRRRISIQVSPEVHGLVAAHLDAKRAKEGRTSVPTLRQFTERALVAALVESAEPAVLDTSSVAVR